MFDNDELRRLAIDHADRLFIDGWGAPQNPRANIWRPQRAGHGDDPRRMSMTGDKRGLWYDSAACEGGDIFEFIARFICGIATARADFARVAAETRARINAPCPAPLRKAAISGDHSQDGATAEALDLLSRAAAPLSGPALAYWTKARGLDMPPEQLVMRIPGGAIPRQPRGSKLPFGNCEAVLIAARDRTGVLQAAQRIFVLPDGGDRDRRRPKLSIGPIGQFPPEFAPRAHIDDPACGSTVFAEGPESAAAIWSATGSRVRVCCGGFGGQLSRLDAGDCAILAIEADAAGSPARNGLAKALKAARSRGVNAVLWRIAEPRGSKADAADLIKRPGGRRIILHLIQEAAERAQRRR